MAIPHSGICVLNSWGRLACRASGVLAMSFSYHLKAYSKQLAQSLWEGPGKGGALRALKLHAMLSADSR